MRFSTICTLFDVVIFCLCFLHLGVRSSTMNPSRLEGNETDRLALLAVKARIEYDPHLVMSSWNESIHFCKWIGVTCSRRHQRVTVLDLRSHQLGWSISPHIGNLSFLRVLYFQNNSFTHEIPQEIGHLHRLQRLGLNNNSFSGEIPANLSGCFNLIHVDSSFNRLVGKIPMELGSLLKLRSIVLRRNNLIGEIPPPSFGNLSNLVKFDAAENNFTGSISDSLGKLTMLTYFSLRLNRLSGTIPLSIYNLSAITFFSVSYNQFQGNLPSDLGYTLPNLQYFDICANQFTGSIPLSISNASNLVQLLTSENKLTGQVPTLQKLCKLERLTIAMNHLGSGVSGDLSFLSDLTNATRLEMLNFGTNNFAGMLPASMCNFSTKLVRIDGSGNKIHGSIPTGIRNLINLELMDMGNNQLTGNVPTDIGNLQKLVKLRFQSNKLSGNIPSSLCNLTRLITLTLQKNNLQGSIPSSLEQCQMLLELDLSQNNLSGAIPEEVVSLYSLTICLNLSANHLSGSLPSAAGSLIHLLALDVSNNMLSGEIPAALGQCVSLEVLNLQGNFIRGMLPQSLGFLKGIQHLDLSCNNISGKIPESFKDLLYLQSLNLSFNDLEGRVPVGGAFQNASRISIVGNSKLCGGTFEFQLPRCKFNEPPPDCGGGTFEFQPRCELNEPPKESRLTHHILTVVVAAVSGFLGITTVLFSVFLYSLRKKNKRKKSNGPASSFSRYSILQVSYTSLLEATNGFSSANLVGVGNFGSVYKGILDDGTNVAVKVFNLLCEGASNSFIAECEALRNIRHRNVVKIVTACSSVDFHGNDFKALVYEFMVNGSLEGWLHSTSGTLEVCEAPGNLNLLLRLNIAIDVACALDYLHNNCQTPIVHGDIRPSNVLLDYEMTGHVADFGLARLLSEVTNNSSANQTSSSGIRGSVGYIAPEYGMGSEASTYGDVYSYGILLLEMFIGKRPTDNMFRDNLNLRNFAKMALTGQVAEIPDLVLLQGGEVGEGSTSTENTDNQYSMRTHKIKECLISILRIGIACSTESPRERMDISVVEAELHSIRDILLGKEMQKETDQLQHSSEGA